MSSKVPVAKERLDRLLVSQGLLTSRESAVRTILAGGVLVDGTVVDKPARLVPRGARIEIERPAPFVSRSGE
jgi:23S rRNA (cytidine1920-2'-O)/16S rRNA (cytidine1409-2'-O)-methyltransferase